MVEDPLYMTSQLTNDTEETRITLVHLYPATTYTVYVTAINEEGEGNQSSAVEGRTRATGLNN